MNDNDKIPILTIPNEILDIIVSYLSPYQRLEIPFICKNLYQTHMYRTKYKDLVSGDYMVSSYLTMQSMLIN